MKNDPNSFSPNDLQSKVINKDCKFIITGANGWLGKAWLEILYNFLGEKKTSQNVFPISSSTSQIQLRNGYKIDAYGYDHKFAAGFEYAIVHLAFLTKDKVSLVSDDDYIKANRIIRDNVTKIITHTNPTGIIYASSGAIYKQDNLYSSLKLEDEKYFSNLADKIGASIVIPRIFNIAGPYINKHNLYALSNFIVQLTNNKEIIINANHPVIRSYIHTADLFKICFGWIFDMSRQEKSIVFDTGNQQEIELGELAKMIISLIDPKGEIIRKDFDDKLQQSYYVGNIDSQNSLCKTYNVSLTGYEEIILDTYKYLSEINSQQYD
ncbi:MAG: nucleoside-diphosphate-sugar epimerase [Rickettsiales bacterium]|jgi:nucleoside-diphosphate-sugar epimerase